VVCNAVVAKLGYLFAFADDILLISLTVSGLQTMLDVVAGELNSLDLYVNVDKCCCLRVGPRFDKQCACIVSSSGDSLRWCLSLRYLGIFIVSSRSFKCDYSQARSSFCRAANSVFSRVGASASEELMVYLFKTKCLPILLYGMEATGLTSREASSVDFVLRRFIIKIFKCSDNLVLDGVYDYMDIQKPSVLARKRGG